MDSNFDSFTVILSASYNSERSEESYFSTSKTSSSFIGDKGTLNYTIDNRRKTPDFRPTGVKDAG
ncbi:hypothetical protein ACP6L2_02980 [Sphingobacterium lactis]|uniref:hypothetical protein n=1 Tax=Sphingobacterium lactis TaxID=797291 RepID=UPI003F7EDC41